MSVHTASASVERGQRWLRKGAAGTANVIRVLAFAEGHAMVRYPRCQVWAIDEKKLRKEFELLTDEKETL